MAKHRLLRRRSRARRLGPGFAAGFTLAAGAALWAIRRLSRPSFAGQTVVITGGSRGLGLLLAREFAREGARLALLARDHGALEEARRDIEARGAEAMTVACDVRDRSAVLDAIERVVERFGGIDVLVNNAGIVQVGPVEHMRLEDFADSLAVHAWGPLYTTLAALPHMQRRGGGRIVNISSIGGKVAVPHLLPYTVGKFALTGLSDGLRAELSKYGIRVTTVCPGLMRTGSHVNAMFKGQHRREFTWFALFDALPITSINAQKAARQVLEATRDGRPELVITPQARLAIVADNLFPGIVARAMMLMNRLLPPPTADEAGDEVRLGWDSWSRWAPSLLTRLADRAVEETNSLQGHAPIVSGPAPS